MPYTTPMAAEIAAMIFQNASLTLLDSGVTQFRAALFTASPGATGTPSNEANYASYARVVIARTGSGWDVTSNVADNANDITWPASSGAPSNTITHVGVTTDAAAGAGTVLMHAAVTPNLVVGTGSTPKIAAGNLVWTTPNS